MCPGGRDGERSLRDVLSHHIVEALRFIPRGERRAGMILSFLSAVEDSNHLGKVSNSQHPHTLNDRGLGTVSLRHHNDLSPLLRGRDGVRGNSGGLFNLTGERELSTERQIMQRLLRHPSESARERDGDRKVKRGALLLNLRGGEVYQDLLTGVEAAVLQRRHDTIPRLTNSGTPKAQNGEPLLTSPNGQLDLHWECVEADHTT
jgi:hypothetical protein